jgi:predicted dehydrogenase
MTGNQAVSADVPDYRPQLPADRSGVAILGCGTIAQTAHLPAYEQYDVEVVGVWSRTAATTAGVRERFASVQRVYADVDELLADPRVRIVDIATGPVGRLHWVERAVAAGKHVLAQKPLTDSAEELAMLPSILATARDRGVRVAVNHNGRWAPPWRLATLLVRDGAVGDVVGVTHLHDKPLPPLAGTPFDDVDHMLISDYLMHWIDITHCWLERSPVVRVRAADSRLPGQPAAARNPWSATVGLDCASGATATIRIAGDVRASSPECPFWVHGTEGTLRGSVLLGSDRLELDRDGTTTAYDLDGEWFVDGFAGAMGELMTAVAEGREPENSAAHAARSVELMLAARESAEHDGVPVQVERGVYGAER